MKKYWNYFKYIIEHKKNVFMFCWEEKMYVHAFLHDMSKFSPTEFISYSKNFYGTPTEKLDSKFDYAWLHHQRKNKHHWEYWVDGNGKALRIPYKYLKQMLCDWKAMGKKFNDTPLSYYNKNKKGFNLERGTRILLEDMLTKRVK